MAESIILLLGALALLAAIVLAYLRAAWGVGLILVGFLGEAFLTRTPPVASLGPIDLFFTDVAMISVLGATVVRLVQVSGRSRVPVAVSALLVLAVVLAVSFVRGVVDFGPQAAGVEFRRYLGFLALAAYVVSFRPDQELLRTLTWMFVAVAYLLLGLTLSRWVVAVMAGEPGRLRVIGARETLLMTQAMLLTFHLVLVRNAGRFLRWTAAILLPVVILLQHRTIWIILIVAFLVMAARERKLRSRLATGLGIATVVGAVGAVLIYGEQSGDVLAGSATEGSTFVWRLIGWRTLLQEHAANPFEMLFGEPFGSGFARFLPELGYTVDVTPHNFYVTLLLRGGVVALVCLLGAYLFAYLGTHREARIRTEGFFGVRAANVLVLSQLVYFLSYDPFPEQGVVLGVALALAAAPQRVVSSSALSPPTGRETAPRRRPAASGGRVGLLGHVVRDDVGGT